MTAQFEVLKSLRYQWVRIPTLLHRSQPPSKRALFLQSCGENVVVSAMAKHSPNLYSYKQLASVPRSGGIFGGHFSLFVI